MVHSERFTWMEMVPFNWLNTAVIVAVAIGRFYMVVSDVRQGLKDVKPAGSSGSDSV